MASRTRVLDVLSPAIVLLVAAWAGVVAASPRLPGPAPRPDPRFVAGVGAPSDRRCASCHAEIAAEWRGSLHQAAWEDDYFQRSYARERGAFCRGCHAPSASPRAEPSVEAQASGVGCSACHVVSEGVVGSHASPGRAGGHAVIGDARLATAEACSGCHEFGFPGSSRPGATQGALMQDTAGEHARSAASATACQGCHMPDVPSRAGGTHRSHAFRVQGDRAMLASAVVVSAVEIGDGELRLSLAPGRIGHAFPTGDIFRRVEVRATPITATGEARPGGAAEVLGRSFEAQRGQSGAIASVERADTRLVGPRRIKLALPLGTRRARWQIVWQRLPRGLAGKLGMDPKAQETVVTEGVVQR